MLFCDGGPGIEDNLLAEGLKAQRCEWHAKRDFPYLLYADGFKKAEQQSLVEKLESVPVMTLTHNDMEKLRPEDRPLVEQMVEEYPTGLRAIAPGARSPTLSPHSNLYRKSHRAGHYVS